MIFTPRHWFAIFAAGFGWSEMAPAQESSPAGSSGSSGSSGSAFGSGSGSSSSFSVFSSSPPSAPIEPAPAPGAATREDAGTAFSVPSYGSGSATPQSRPPSFTVPGFYGQGSTTFFGGSGRLARPRFRTGLTFGIGYDDNIFSTPSDDTPRIVPGGTQFVDAPEQPEQVQQFEERVETVRTGNQIDLGGGLLVPEEIQVITRVPIENEEQPAALPQERKGSMFSRVGMSLEMQRYSRRSLFTLNASLAHNYYWDKDEEPVDYSGSFAVMYLYRVTPRLQVTAQANIAYISQPDLSRPNTPQQEIQGDLINSLVRLDAAYRITPRFSITGTANYDSNRYTETTEQSGDFDSYTFGIEARYLWTPRLTLLGELRRASTVYSSRDDINSNTNYLLFGGEFVLSQRLTGSLRLGAANKSFDTGDQQTAPYVESTVAYRSTARSAITWTNRFGFEEPQSATDERLVYRANIAYRYTFNPHLQGNIGANIVHELTTSTLSDDETTVDTFELALGLEYQLARNFSLTSSYTFTLLNTNTPNSDYYRNRLFLGGQYNF